MRSEVHSDEDWQRVFIYNQERYLNGQEYELGSTEGEIVTLERWSVEHEHPNHLPSGVVGS